MPAAEPISRRYRGASVEQRRAERRDQLIEAAIAVYGERGYRNATVKAVCEAAGLTERYFYESFPNSEALLVAAFRKVTDFLHGAMEAAADQAEGGAVDRARAILQAYYALLKAHPSPARVFLVEIAGVSAEVDQVMYEALREFADGLAPREAGPAGGPDDLLRWGVVGGVVQIALSWIAAGYAHPLETVVEDALRLCRIIVDDAGGPSPA